MILLDTDHLSVLTDARHRFHASLISRLTQADEPIALPAVAVEEPLRAWLAQVHRVHDAHELTVPYGRLVHLLKSWLTGKSFAGRIGPRMHLGRFASSESESERKI